MNRNAESHFSINPTSIDISRSIFDQSHSVKTTFNVGDIVPFEVTEVYPGDTFNYKTSKVVRMQTLLTPFMDNIYLDTYYFFVPNRLLWEHWREFNGENRSGAWVPQTTYTVPQITAPSGGWNVGTIADYFGIPTGVGNLSVNALPFRAYAMICDEWFRDQNLCDPLVIATGDSTVAGVNTGTFVTDVAKGGLPYRAAKYHDYFTSCLPSPQKGPDVILPIGSSSVSTLPVMTGKDSHDVGGYVLSGKTNNGSEILAGVHGSFSSGQTQANVRVMDTYYGKARSGSFASGFDPDNLYADASGFGITVGTINELRTAFQIQKYYEKAARGGTRYIESIKSQFGVTSPDARQQRPEYLGGNRVPISINQVIQQSETTSTSPQGNVAGYSLTTDFNDDFIKSFTEHGFVIGVMVARYDHTYQQGLERFWSRSTLFDYYFPVFANLGEQAVKNKEIYAQGSSAVNPSTGVAYDEEVFGYQEAWADLRYRNNRVTGEMRSSYTASLDSWHLADDYSQLPHLSDSWIVEDSATVDRVLAVSSNVSHQLFADIYMQCRATRPLPMYSIPGLIDHH